jgi:SAM-dependent methyltransferase
VEQKAYWEQHGKAFAGLYERPTLVNRLFRGALYLRARMAVDAVRAAPGATVLDVGCGSGRNSVLFVKEAGASRVLGVDLSDEMLRMARQLAADHGVADRVSFVQADFLEADLGDEVFDFSVALGFMDYFRDPLPVLQKMRRHTRRAALATFPGWAPLRMALRKIRYGLRGCGVYAFRKGEIERLYREAGFAGCRIERCTLAGWMATGYVNPAEERRTP